MCQPIFVLSFAQLTELIVRTSFSQKEEKGKIKDVD